MTSEIVNFNKARKARAKELKQNEAARNRVVFGQSKAERKKDEAIRARLSKELDGLRIEPDEPDNGVT